MTARALFLHQAAILGGAEAHLLSVARHYRGTSRVALFADGPLRGALQDAGVEVRVLASDWAAAGVRRGVPRLNARGVAAVLGLAWKVARMARGAEVVYANSPKALIVAEAAGALVRRPVIWHLHDLLDTAHFSPQAIRQVVRRANRIAARVLVASRAGADAFVRWGGRGGLVHVVDAGFDADDSDDSEEGDDGNGGSAPTIGVFGRITPWKGQHLALEALAALPGVEALFVGDEGEEPEYAAALRRRADEPGLRGRVRFLGFRSDVRRLMRSVDVVVHSSVAPEPFGRVVVEAMLAGRPVVAARAGGVPEIVEDGVSGVLFTPGEAGDMAAAIAALLADPARMRGIGESGRRQARQRFDSRRMLREIDRHVEAAAVGGGRAG